MGAINSAFNQAVGAIAGSALAIKHAKESDFSKMNTAEHAALIANNQAVDAKAEADKAKLEEEKSNLDYINAIISSWGKDEEYYKAQEEYDNKIQKGQKASYKAVQKKLTEWEASKRAIAELENKINGIDAMKKRALDQRAYADRASQIASKAQQKYQSRWGGMR